MWRAEISLNELNERLWEIRVAYTGRRITLVLSMLFTTSSSAYVGACNELDGMLQSYDFMRLELAGVAPMSRMCADPLCTSFHWHPHDLYLPNITPFVSLTPNMLTSAISDRAYRPLSTPNLELFYSYRDRYLYFHSKHPIYYLSTTSINSPIFFPFSPLRPGPPPEIMRVTYPRKLVTRRGHRR